MKGSCVPTVRRAITRLCLGSLAGAVMLAAMIGWGSLFVVDATEIAVVHARGHAGESTVARAGLCVKWPWQTVHRVDRRVRVFDLDSREKRTQDHESVVVRPCVYWRVANDRAERFLRSVRNDAVAEPLLADLVWSVLDRELARRPLTDWLNPVGDRESAGEPPQLAILARVTAICRSEALSRLGIDLLDVQLRQFSRPERLTGDLLRLMAADDARRIGRTCLAVDFERNRLAVDALREADRILSEAEDRAARIRADGRREALSVEGEARAINAALADYMLQLNGYRKMAAGGDSGETLAGLPGPPLATQAAVFDKKPASTGQAPTPDTAPAPRSGNKARTRPE